MKRDSDEYADLLTGAKLEVLLEDFYQGPSGDISGMREYADHLVKSSAGCEFLISKAQVRITFDLRPAAADPPADPAPQAD